MFRRRPNGLEGIQKRQTRWRLKEFAPIDTPSHLPARGSLERDSGRSLPVMGPRLGMLDAGKGVTYRRLVTQMTVEHGMEFKEGSARRVPIRIYSSRRQNCHANQCGWNKAENMVRESQTLGSYLPLAYVKLLTIPIFFGG